MAEIDEFLQQVLADQRAMDADPTPQTPAYALVAVGKFQEAEVVARQAVSDLEKENGALAKPAAAAQSQNVISKRERAETNQNSTAENNSQLSLLAEALIAHGIVLARLKNLEAAQATLERAIAVAHEAGAPEKAGLAALTMIEELEQLSREKLLSVYEQASEGMATVRNRKLQWRVINAARKVMASFLGEMSSDRALEILLARSPTFDEVGYEEPLIDQVLTHTDGSLSEVTSSLTQTPGGLAYIIELRPKGVFKK